MDSFINKYSLIMRFIITFIMTTVVVVGTIAVFAPFYLLVTKESSTQDLQPTREVSHRTTLFGEINFETNPLTLPWKK